MSQVLGLHRNYTYLAISGAQLRFTNAQRKRPRDWQRLEFLSAQRSTPQNF
jgi:hypothetical protein